MPLAPLLAALLAASSPGLVVAPAAARPGDAVLVRVIGAIEAAPEGKLAGRALQFWREGAEWRALAPLTLEVPVGQARVEAVAGGVSLEASLEVVPPGFASASIELPKKYVEPPASARKRMAADRAAFVEAQKRPFSPPLFRSGFGWPRPRRATGRFGDQRLVNGKKASVHYGLDLSGERGAPVEAAADGVVALVRNAYLSGNTLLLWHGAGVYTLYLHMDRIDVQQGEEVRRGQVVGRVGSTGQVTGPHLHWSAKVDGLYVDPESLLAIDFAAGTAVARASAASPQAQGAPSAAEEPPAGGDAREATPEAAPATRP
ncbi:MAG TPA: M23 family metallopeptidase [Thermoanaerobaculia bacterium]|nr:M23 family metallopeptidase [Thermoanaerobaculia bacterium]